MRIREMPPSPPPSHSGELLQHGLHHVAQHNAENTYPQEHYPNEGAHVQYSYSSPTPGRDDGYTYRGPNQQPRFQYQPQHQESGPGMQYVRVLKLSPAAAY
jgi:hypothetical protein